MALIVWNYALSVGVDSLDADHIVVASLINHIDDAKQSASDERAVGRILRVLVEHAFAHFTREETLLETHSYPLLEQHRREHRLIEEQLQELCEAYERTADPELSREIMQILHFWLVEHIMKVDMHYKAFLEDKMLEDQALRPFSSPRQTAPDLQTEKRT
jgi:hemerythrin-like metal-binding protein